MNPVAKNGLKRFVVSSLAATVTLNLINFACCISASVYNGRMFGPCSHRQPHLSRSFCRYQVYRDNKGNVSAIDPNYLQILNSDFKKGEGLQALSQAIVLFVIFALYCIHGVWCHRRIHAAEAQLASNSRSISLRISHENPMELATTAALSPKHLRLGAVVHQMGELRTIKRRTYAVMIICGVSMILRAAFNLCETAAPPIARCTSSVAQLTPRRVRPDNFPQY